MIVTGIGSRPKGLPLNAHGDIESWLVDLVRDVATVAKQNCWILRSGGADGMDDLFERLWDHHKEIYLPRDGFRGHRAGHYGSILVDDPIILNQAVSIVSKVHPKWKSLDKMSKEFHTRNVFQALGENLDKPSDICVFYAQVNERGEVEGGTRTAVEICRNNNVPTYNLRDTDDVINLKAFLNLWRKHG